MTKTYLMIDVVKKGSAMAFNQEQFDKITLLAKDYGATRLILFGSAQENPDTARVTLINRISAFTKLFSTRKAQKTISNALKEFSKGLCESFLINCCPDPGGDS